MAPDLLVCVLGEHGEAESRRSLRSLSARFPASKLLVLANIPGRDSVEGARAAGARVLFRPCHADRLLYAATRLLNGAMDHGGTRNNRTIFSLARAILCSNADDVDIAARASAFLRRATPHVLHANVDRLVELARAADVVVVTPSVPRANPQAIVQLETGIVIIDDGPVGELPHGPAGAIHVHPADVQSQLPEAVCLATAMRGRRLLSRELESESVLAPDAVALLDVACERDLPPLFLTDAAEFVKVERTRATKQWSATRSSATCPRLLDAFDWILLWRVVLEKKPGWDWIAACKAIGMQPHRFRSLVLRLTGGVPEELLDFDDWRAFSPFRSVNTFGTAIERCIQ